MIAVGGCCLGVELESKDITDGVEEAEVTNAGVGEEENLAAKPKVSGDELSSRLLLSSLLSSSSCSGCPANGRGQ